MASRIQMSGVWNGEEEEVESPPANRPTAALSHLFIFPICLLSDVLGFLQLDLLQLHLLLIFLGPVFNHLHRPKTNTSCTTGTSSRVWDFKVGRMWRTVPYV